MWHNEQLTVIYVATDEKQLSIGFPVGGIVEDLCTQVCKLFEIGPVARHLFALRSHSSKLWFPCGHKLESGEKSKFDFRLRFKPSSVQRLKQIDEQAYNYYFQQARNDIMDNNVPDIIYERHKRELIGLGVSDMYRVMLEKQIPRETVESDYKKYIPKECIKRHAFFIKKPIHNALGRISGHDASYVKEQYLKQFECIAPNYPYEEYKALMDKGIPNPPAKVLLRVNIESVKYCEMDTGTWNILCAIEDLCFISIRQDSTVEISRKSGIPSYLKFATNALLMSFVSALDGYYRLAIKWTFNLCGDVITPTVERLHNLRCHGPIGKEFSYIKLKEKRAKKPGSYILRESETEYNVYYIDICDEDGKMLSQRVEQIETNKFLIPDSTETYDSLGHLISSFQDRKDPLHLTECLPPSEYDKSPLLICAAEDIGNEVAADEKIITALLDGGPRCVSRKQLQVYKAFTRSDEDLTRVSVTRLHRAMWRVAKGKKLEVVMKILKNEENNYTKEFLELADKWGQLRSSALVRLYGITVAPAIGMLLELVELGPLDKYLRSNSPQTVKTVDLVEATTCVAKALWHLEENGVVHGNIRCNRLLVHLHTNNSFIIKLADPGIFTYTEADIHWIPPEYYGNLESAKRSSQADIWALATTTWQIFSRGISPSIYSDINVIKKLYQGGRRLSAPTGCPHEVYKLMLECWGESNAPRKQPQAITRDINQILYQVFNSRRTHAYATAFPKLFNDVNQTDEDNSDMAESQSVNSESHASSLVTDHTSLTWDDTDDATRQLVNHPENDIASTEPFCVSWLTSSVTDTNECNTWTLSGAGNESAANNLRLTDEDSFSDMVRLSNDTTNDKDSIHIFEMDMDSTVIQQGLIGQGFYGEVYRGTLEKQGKNDLQQVAVKKLKTLAIEAIRDFEREISIMKTLKHPNIVEVLGVTTEGHLVMEYVKHGSLQSYLAIHRHTLTHKKLLSFALDVATGMDYLGSMNIVHRDLAARNILVANENLVKISDFGLAQVIGKNDYYILQTNRDLPIKWYAPESLRYGKFSPRSDVWSFGVTMYETFSLGEDPKLPGIELNHKNGGADQGGSADLVAALERGARLPCPPTCPQTVYVKLMYPCWDIHSHGRPNFATLRKDILELLNEY